MMKAENIFLCYKKELEITASSFSVALCITMISEVIEILDRNRMYLIVYRRNSVTNILGNQIFFNQNFYFNSALKDYAYAKIVVLCIAFSPFFPPFCDAK